MDFANLLDGLPPGLRSELISEYQEIVSNFYEGRWKPSELSAGRFCEVAFAIIEGRTKGAYPLKAAKPPAFESACRSLENQTQLERGLRMLALKILPALYEVRNNRGVGHVGGDVDSNYMDSSFAVGAAGWILGELIRVYHNVSVDLATQAVDHLTQIRMPAVWVDSDVRRVLNTGLRLEDQILLLLASAGSNTTFDELASWTETSNRTYLRKVLKKLHDARLIEASDSTKIRLTPKAAERVRAILG